MQIQTKRVYEPADQEDGFRILVDRVWPRGLTREHVLADLWLKEAGPSTELRKQFGHEPSRWDEFKHRYFAELEAKPDLAGRLRALAGQGRLTLLYSAHDTRHNQAEALKEFLLARAE